MSCTGRCTGQLGRDPVTPFPFIGWLRGRHHPVHPASKLDCLVNAVVFNTGTAGSAGEGEGSACERLHQQIATAEKDECRPEAGVWEEGRRHKVLKRSLEQYKVEAATKLKVTPLTNCNGDHLLESRNPKSVCIWATLSFKVESTLQLLLSAPCTSHC